MKQQFLITVQRMCTSDENDLVSGWSAIVAESDLHKITLQDAADFTLKALVDIPDTNIRPMTEAEIAAWRKAQ